MVGLALGYCKLGEARGWSPIIFSTRHRGWRQFEVGSGASYGAVLDSEPRPEWRTLAGHVRVRVPGCEMRREWIEDRMIA